ncbi:Protein C3orf33 [Strongyloides ratti]|uniref:Protein C3orf33 n=1 Tax=Strongyloides ratti TaxID=34506 RepID=A0A090LB09_STRRB|nr:Protein C3orf33 [Strongyloides ratti]CEF66947.1 Protein C3orf33 [Strongyloides ratti]
MGWKSLILNKGSISPIKTNLFFSRHCRVKFNTLCIVLAYLMETGESGKTLAINKPFVAEDASFFQLYSPLIIRGGIIVTGIVGVAIYLKTSPNYRRFKHVTEIPQHFIQREIPLKGIVKEVTPFGTFKVEHQPLRTIPFITPIKKVQPLNLKLAGIEFSEEGLNYLTNELKIKDKKVNFTVIKNTHDNSDSVDVEMTIKKNLLGFVNMNQDLVRKGYAKIPSPNNKEHINSLEHIPTYSRLINKLLLSEKIADKRGLGMWEKESWMESVKSVPTQSFGIIKSSPFVKFIVLLFTIMKDAAYLSASALKNLYYIIVVTMGYVAVGYRKFGRGVDSMRIKYNGLKEKFKK